MITTVCNLSKNSIWKQITTTDSAGIIDLLLYAIYQRTQSESKSQRLNQWIPFEDYCMQSIKELNLKANHNRGSLLPVPHFTVCNLSKNSIWKQITTSGLIHTTSVGLYAIYQWTQSESKSQHPSRLNTWLPDCMQSIKELNLKANHNGNLLPLRCLRTVCNLSKNSIWKQITTIFSPSSSRHGLYAIYQRTQSESKSQQIWMVAAR